MAIRRLTHATVLVDDLDKSLAWYQDVLGMEVRMDQPMEAFDGMRWLTVGFPGEELEFVLSRPMPTPGKEDEDVEQWIGNGTMWVLGVDDLRATAATLKEKGVVFSSDIEEMPWGLSAIIRDPDGNPFNLVESRSG